MRFNSNRNPTHYVIRVPDDAGCVCSFVPIWMFDSRICARISLDDKPTISVEAILKLRALLDAQTKLMVGQAPYAAGEEKEPQGGENAAAAESTFTESRGRIGVGAAIGSSEKRVYPGAEHATEKGLGGEQEGERR